MDHDLAEKIAVGGVAWSGTITQPNQSLAISLGLAFVRGRRTAVPIATNPAKNPTAASCQCSLSIVIGSLSVGGWEPLVSSFAVKVGVAEASGFQFPICLP